MIIKDFKLAKDTEKEYWHLRLFSRQEDALESYEWYVKKGCPAFLFSSPFGYIVASYADDETHLEAPSHGVEESYAGRERVYECLKMYTLLRVNA